MVCNASLTSSNRQRKDCSWRNCDLVQSGQRLTIEHAGNAFTPCRSFDATDQFLSQSPKPNLLDTCTTTSGNQTIACPFVVSAPRCNTQSLFSKLACDPLNS